MATLKALSAAIFVEYYSEVCLCVDYFVYPTPNPA